MKLEVCIFSGAKIYPGHGSRYIRVDGRTCNFVNSKSRSLYMQRKNPRKISWTVLYRRKMKKGIQEEVLKRRTRRTKKFTRAVEGLDMDALMKKRNQTAEVRKAQREHMVRAAKEKKREAATQKKTTKPAFDKNASKAVKNVPKSAPRVGGKR